jgi:hypothetical protein
MANVYAIKSGNWSDTTVWNTGILPTTVDIVRPNGFTVVINQDITVSELRSDASSPAVGGGTFDIYTNCIINCTTIRPGLNTTTGYSVRNYNPGTTTINSTITGANPILLNDTIGTLIIVGNIIGSANGWIIVTNQNGNLTIIGNLSFTGSGINSTVLSNNSSGVVNITGNLTGGPATSNNVTIRNSLGIINITGNVIGGANASNNFAIANSSIGTINITGTVLANTAPSISSTTSGIINVIGQLQASTSTNAIQSTSTTATNVFSGPFINSGSRNAIYCYNVQMYDDVTTRYTIGVSGSTDTISLLSPDQVTGVPSGSDVRVGTIYGPGNELTGSMNVPNPQSVSIGVAVDQTTGSAIVKPEDLWNYAVTTLTGSNTIGQRLANTNTSSSMAAIVSAFSS